VPVDWQAGYTRVLLIVAGAAGDAFQDRMMERIGALRGASDRGGIDQVLAGIAPRFAALWIHSSGEIGDERIQALVPEGASIRRDLPATPAPVIGEREKGVTISGASAFTFRFSRYMEFFDTRPPAPTTA
jgi:hypothetical protein